MSKQPAKRSTLFLMELIIVILFFCLTSSICIQLFVKSHILNQDSTNLNVSVNEVSSVAALVGNNSEIEEVLLREYPLAACENGLYTIYYNENWELCSKDEATFSMDIIPDKESDLDTCSITMKSMKDSNTIYELDVKTHRKEGLQF